MSSAPTDSDTNSCGVALPNSFPSADNSESNTSSKHLASSPTNHNDNNFPLISVIIPYKRYQVRTLLQAIESATSQTYPNVEVIVVGGDAQATRELISLCSGNSRVSIVQSLQPNGTFAGYTRNLGAFNHSSADSQYLAFLDADDAWLPQKLELQHRFAQLYDALDFSCTEVLAARTCRYDEESSSFAPWNITHLDPHTLVSGAGGGSSHFFLYNGGIHKFMLEKKLGLPAGMSLPVTIDLETLKRHNAVITSTVLMSRALFEAAGGFDPTIHRVEDYDLWKRAMTIASQNDNNHRFSPTIGYFHLPLAIYDWKCHGADGTAAKKRDGSLLFSAGTP